MTFFSETHNMQLRVWPCLSICRDDINHWKWFVTILFYIIFLKYPSLYSVSLHDITSVYEKTFDFSRMRKFLPSFAATTEARASWTPSSVKIITCPSQLISVRIDAYWWNCQLNDVVRLELRTECWCGFKKVLCIDVNSYQLQVATPSYNALLAFHYVPDCLLVDGVA